MSVGQGSTGVHAPPAGAQGTAGITYTTVDESYFEARRLKRHARVWSLWALGVGAVISGHYSGWNLGLSNGFGSMFFATIIIAIMYLGLTFSIAEMSPALPHTGGAYSFARTSMGPWAGYITGIAENIEFVLTPAVIVFFIGSYLSAIFETAPAFQPVYWILCYALFVGLNIVGVELSFKVTVGVTVAALAVLAFFYVSVLLSGQFDFSRWALNIGPDGAELPNGNGAFLPFGFGSILASLPFAVWLFLAIEQLPLAAEESHDPQTRHAQGHHRRHPDAHRLRVPRALPEHGHRAGCRRPRQVRRAAARRVPHPVRHGYREDPGGDRGDRSDRLVPHHHLRLRPADLLALAGRLLPERSCR